MKLFEKIKTWFAIQQLKRSAKQNLRIIEKCKREGLK